MRARRQASHVLAQRVGGRDRAELGLPLALGLRGLGGEAAEVAGGGGRGGAEGQAEGGCGDSASGPAPWKDPPGEGRERRTTPERPCAIPPASRPWLRGSRV